MLQPSPDMGDTCLVEWASGSQGVYATGKDDRFELVHLETSRTSGAPVVGQCWTGDTEHQHVSATERGKGAVLLWGGSELQRPDHLVVPEDLSGHPVERGTHWTYGGAEPGVGLTRGAATVGQKGPHNLLGEQGATTAHLKPLGCHKSPGTPGNPIYLQQATTACKQDLSMHRRLVRTKSNCCVALCH